MALSCILILTACWASWTDTISTDVTATDELRNSQPEARADIQGTVKSIVGNEFTIETTDMSSSETLNQMQDPDFRTKMQAMSDTERQALTTKMQEERTNAKKILIEVTIPVGVPLLVRTGGGGGGFARGAGGGGATRTQWIGSSLGANANAQPTAPTGKQWTIADVKVGSTVSIWLTAVLEERKIASWVSVSGAQWNIGNTDRAAGGFQRPTGGGPQ